MAREEDGTAERQASHYAPLHTYDLPKGTDRQYSQQYADMYFTRLALLREDVEQVADEAWRNFEVRPEPTYTSAHISNEGVTGQG